MTTFDHLKNRIPGLFLAHGRSASSQRKVEFWQPIAVRIYGPQRNSRPVASIDFTRRCGGDNAEFSQPTNGRISAAYQPCNSQKGWDPRSSSPRICHRPDLRYARELLWIRNRQRASPGFQLIPCRPIFSLTLLSAMINLHAKLLPNLQANRSRDHLFQNNHGV